MMMNHSIHLRAQLGVDLRLNDVPAPTIYGPSADEESISPTTGSRLSGKNPWPSKT
jgi:hypothetical protein